MGKLLGDQAADQIIQLIIDNDGKAGDKMPNEYELAEQLNVSRSTVREAIKALVSRNILEIKRGSGTFISEKCGISDDPLGLMFVKNKLKLATDLLEIRFMIEPKIASLAAANATDEEKLRDINDALKGFGFAYDLQKDIFYSLENAWQRKMGYGYSYYRIC